jgi:DNA repair protein RadC
MNVMEHTMNQHEWYQIQEVELVYKSKLKASLRPVLKDSKDVYALLLQTWDQNKIELQEQFKILLLNRGNKVLGIYEASTGGIAGTVADPRLIFITALKGNACNIVLAHNHPSGNLKPSKADEALTQKLIDAGNFLDIRVLDHLIISPESYYSFADEGLM